MKKATISGATVCLFIAASLGSSAAYAQEVDPVGQVQAAFEDMSGWLGEGESGQGWHSYLKSDELRAQLAAGDKADKEVVGQVLEQYSSGAAGLSSRRFVAVRRGLEEWLAVLSLPKAHEVPALVREASAGFTPVSPSEVRSSLQQVRGALVPLGYLLRGTNGQGWRRFLGWDALESQLSEAEPDMEVLEAIADKFASGQRGLELPRFQAVGTALADYVTKLRVAHDPEAEQHYGEQLEALASALEAFQRKPDGAQLETAAKALQWLEDRGQAAEVAEHVRRHFFKPNLRIELSAGLVTFGFSRGERTEPTEVNDLVGSSRVRGSGTSTSTVESILVPHPRVAVIHNIMTGVTRLGSTAAGDNGVTVRSTSLTDYSAIKQLSISPNGFRDYPATARARTTSEIQSINPGGYPYDRVRSAVYERLPGNQRAAARRAEQRIRTKMDRNWSERTAEANKSFHSRFRKPLVDLGAFPSELRFSTLTDRMRVVGREARPGEPSAATEPPERIAGHDMFVRVHETMANNMWRAMYGGRTMTQDEFNAEMQQFFGESERFQRDEDEVPWEMTFDAESPMTMMFGDGTLTMTIRATRFRSGDAPFQNHAMNMTAKYKVVRSGGGSKAVRQGDVVVLPPGYVVGKSGTLSAGQLGVRRQLLKLSDDMFDKELLGDGIELSGDWEEAGTLQLKHMQTHGDWLSLGWKLESTTTAKKETAEEE